jgi:hypothetical protein
MEKRIKVAELTEQRRLAKLEEQHREQEQAKPVVLASVTFVPTQRRTATQSEERISFPSLLQHLFISTPHLAGGYGPVPDPYPARFGELQN